ncbi:MAG TPA: hypothetical protein PLT82_05770 [Candidatus Hydrogenedens sp.]|nr:hypothetical protein [Candidatus Hydrogenedens sp.]HPP58622.1 hypothetical protein [Candidatus Hydrogenedens sp.]
MQNRQQIIIAGVLLVALIGVLFYQFVLNKPKPPTTSTTPTTSQTKTESTPVTTQQKTTITGEINPSIQTLEQDVDKVIEDLLSAIRIVQFDYQQTPPLRNPMTPLVGVIKKSIFESEVPIPSSEVTPGQVLNKKISAIIWDEYQPLAIIDGKIVPEGYTFPDRIQVFSIEPNRILFKLEDTIFPVRLKEQ